MAYDAFPTQSLRAHLESRRKILETERSRWWTHWRELSDFILPRRGQFLVTPNDTKGGEVNKRIIDSTGTLAARILASGMMSGVTSPSRPWFKLTVSDEDLADNPDVRGWLDHVQARMERVFAKSNIYNNLPVLYEELGVFGTGVLLVFEDYEDVITTVVLSVGEYMLALDDKGRVNTLIREFVLTVAQVVAQFGIDKVSMQTAMHWRNGKYDVEIPIVHAIEPNVDQIPGAKDAKGMPFRSVYYEKTCSEQDKFLRVSGFKEFPGMTPRWHVIGNEPYGRSPGMDALPDIKQLQSEMKAKGVAIQKIVNPPMVAPVELAGEPASTLPGGTTYLANPDGKKFAPAYEIAPTAVTVITEDIEDVRKRVQQAFFADLFLMWEQMEGVQPRNTDEVNVREQEKLLQLGPVLERFQYEGLQPLIERTYTIMERAGMIPPAPQALHGKALDIEFTSIMAQAQKAVATTAIEQFASFVGSLAGVQPQVIAKVDFDKMVEDYGVKLGVPSDIIVDEQTVMKVRAQQQAQQAAAQQQQQSLALAQGAQTLSKTQVGGGQSALEKMLGQ